MITNFRSLILKVVSEILSVLFYSFYKLFYKKVAHPKAILFVDSKKILKNIDKGSIVRQRRLYLTGVILSGSWDEEFQWLFSDLGFNYLFEDLSRLTENNLTIEKSHWYEVRKDKCKTPSDIESIKEEVDKKMKKYYKIYQKIKTDGFIIPRSVFDKTDFFYVCISANGDYLFMTGNHRLIIAKILALRGYNIKIPVRVSHRHSKWQAFRDELYVKYKKNILTRRDIENIGHEDLIDIIS